MMRKYYFQETKKYDFIADEVSNLAMWQKKK